LNTGGSRTFRKPELRSPSGTLIRPGFDERPLVFGKDGHLEFSQRAGHEEIVKERAKEDKTL